jgi:hypothetical protein
LSLAMGGPETIGTYTHTHTVRPTRGHASWHRKKKKRTGWIAMHISETRAKASEGG